MFFRHKKLHMGSFSFLFSCPSQFLLFSYRLNDVDGDSDDGRRFVDGLVAEVRLSVVHQRHDLQVRRVTGEDVPPTVQLAKKFGQCRRPTKFADIFAINVLQIPDSPAEQVHQDPDDENAQIRFRSLRHRQIKVHDNHHGDENAVNDFLEERLMDREVDGDEEEAVERQRRHHLGAAGAERLPHLIDAVGESGRAEHHRDLVHELHGVHERHVEEPRTDADDEEGEVAEEVARLVAFPVDVDDAVKRRDDHEQVGHRVPEFGDIGRYLRTKRVNT